MTQQQVVQQDTDLKHLVEGIARDALAASRSLAVLSTEAKNRFLLNLAQAIEDAAQELKDRNARDLAAGEKNGLSKAMLDRLRLTDERISGMAEGVRQVAALPDPVGAQLSVHPHPKGFAIEKVRVPIGVIGIIYESRPNVTIDCAALCLKSGNATILRGGREAFESNQALAEIITRTLRDSGIDEKAVQLIPTTDRAALSELLRLDHYVHCIIPRGGEGLIRFVAENARMPVIKHYKGVCNVYLDEKADPAMAREIVINAKCQRPSVCNAAENLVVHASHLETLFLETARDLAERGVELRADARAFDALNRAGIAALAATEEDWQTEYVDLILAIRTVDSLDEAIEFINANGSGHSDAIVTSDPATAETFLAAVDSATVYWNVSTRFTDGFEFGMGAEIGISTDRLHARGPMGLEELTSYKFRIRGHGEVR